MENVPRRVSRDLEECSQEQEGENPRDAPESLFFFPHSLEGLSVLLLIDKSSIFRVALDPLLGLGVVDLGPVADGSAAVPISGGGVGCHLSMVGSLFHLVKRSVCYFNPYYCLQARNEHCFQWRLGRSDW